MKSIIRLLYLSVITVLLSSILQGCGGGGNPSGGNGGVDDGDGNPVPPSQTAIKYRRVSIAGSSITHGEGDGQEDGDGYLGEKSYVGQVERYLREEVADTIGPEELGNADDVIDTPMSYQGKLKVYGAGVEITGVLKSSDEIAIAYGSSGIETVIEMEIDDEVYTYTIPTGTYLPVKKSYDDTNVDFYKAFRQTNEKAVKIWKLEKNQQHPFKLRVIKGELHLNFITNHMFFMQNAGVSGYEAADFLNNNIPSNVQGIIDFDPDIFILESSTNDAKTWKKENNGSVASTNNWIIEEPINFTIDGKNIICAQSVDVKKGDIVIMGEYGGDIQNMVVGIVANDTNSRTITFSKIVSYQNQVINELNTVPQNIVKKCTIKSIEVWENRVKEVIRRVKNGVGHTVVVGIATSGVPNYYKPGTNQYSDGIYTPRRLLGYREKGEILAQENGWFFVDFFQRILQVEPGVDIDHKWTYGDNTHPNAPGRIYFGDAVIQKLKTII